MLEELLRVLRQTLILSKNKVRPDDQSHGLARHTRNSYCEKILMPMNAFPEIFV